MLDFTTTKQSQLFIANWNHEAALFAIETAPVRDLPAVPDVPPVPPIVAIAGVPPVAPIKSQNLSAEISAEELQTDVEYLASDALEGRMTGSNGTRLAADYIAKRFQEIGLKPFEENETYFQEFQFTAGMEVIPAQNELTVIKADGEFEQHRKFDVDQDFRPLSFSDNGEVEGEVVFAGYGLSVPGELGVGYNSYSGLDVKDKIVVVLRYVPEEVDAERRQELNRYAGLRYKAMIAREHGAKALIVVAGPNSLNAGKLVPLSFDNSLAGSGIIAASISGEIAELLFTTAGKNLKETQSGLDLENPHFEGRFPLSNVKLKIQTALERVKKTDRNVIGFLPPTDVADDTEYLVVGAHYDHIGHGKIGSLARKGEEGHIHNGADDNASAA